MRRMLRKGRVRWVSGTDVRRQNQFINKMFELAADHPGTPFDSPTRIPRTDG
jgi:hypothetical protein